MSEYQPSTIPTKKNRQNGRLEIKKDTRSRDVKNGINKKKQNLS